MLQNLIEFQMCIRDSNYQEFIDWSKAEAQKAQESINANRKKEAN